MTNPAYVLRPMVPEDGAKLVELALSSPDTGQIQVAARYHLDAYQANVALHPDTAGVVAAVPGTGEIVASAFVSLHDYCYEGELRQCAWLHNLLVRPNYRRQGIATKLAEWRVDYARERIGDEGIVAAIIQKGNEGSFAVARTWCRQFQGEVRSGAVDMRRRPPKTLNGVVVRTAVPDDFEPIAYGLNRFYDEYNFFAPQTTDSLAEWLAKSPFGRPFRHYYVAVNQAGSILAGLAISEQYRISEMEVQHLPAAMRLLNRLVRFVPADGRLRQISAHKVWFAHGQLRAARYLWDSMRWQWRERGNTVTFRYDPRSPLKDVFRSPLWMPEGSFTFALSAPEPMSEDRLIAVG